MVQERNPGQHRHVLPEAGVGGRLAATGRRVVHAGKVVQHQRGGVDHLNRAGHVQRRLHGAAELGGGQEQEERAEALARRRERMVHGRRHWRSARRRPVKEPRLKLRPQRLHPGPARRDGVHAVQLRRPRTDVPPTIDRFSASRQLAASASPPRARRSELNTCLE